MDSSTRNFRQIQAIQLPQTIVTISASHNSLAVGCLDDSLNIWKFINDKLQSSPIFSWTGSATGIIDAKFNQNCSSVAATFMDSKVRTWEIQTQKISNIQCPVMSAWKMEYIGDSIVTCGDVGRINFFNQLSGESERKIQVGDVHLTSISKTNDENLLAVGNSSGSCYIVNLQKKDRVVSLKPHYKLLRTLSFTEDSSKLLTGSDDSTIKVLDIASEKVITSLEGHKETVSSIHCHPSDSRIAYSCSFDKSIKCWDLRMKSCVGNLVTGSPLWSCQVIDKKLITGGQNGILFVYSLE